MDSYGSVWDFFEADGYSLKELYQIAPQTGQAIIDRVEASTPIISFETRRGLPDDIPMSASTPHGFV